jgi:beta-fructofuranosidase
MPGDSTPTAPCGSARTSSRSVGATSCWCPSSRASLTTHVQVGHFDGRTFRPTWTGKVDHGVAYYAALTFLDGQGRRLMFGWLKEERAVSAQLAAGWSGVLSLPRELTLVDDQLVMRPPAELRALRRDRVELSALRLEPGSPHALDVSGDALEIRLALAGLGDAALELSVRATADRQEVTTIRIDGAASQVRVDTRRSSLDPTVTPGESVATHEFGESTVLHVYLDRSILEVFVDERICVSARMYPTRPDSEGVSLEAARGAVNIRALDVWQMGSIWEEAWLGGVVEGVGDGVGATRP